MNYIDCFKRSVEQYPDRVALVDLDGKRKTSYATLDELSSKVAGKLKNIGCSLGDFVLINIDRRLEYVVAYLGILKAGCCVIPAIPEYPKERISYMTQNSKAKIIIDIDFFKDIDNYNATCTLCGDSEPAVLVYTSGSTGTPKGILHTMRNLTDATQRQTGLFDGVDKPIFAASASMSFVVFVSEYLSVFLLGGCTHIISDKVRKDIQATTKYYSENGITIGFLSPQMLYLFKNEISSLKRVFTGSERLAGFYSKEFEVYNIYGMSETLAGVSFFKVDKSYDNTPIGKPLSGVKIIILDENGNEISDSSEGEICLEMCSDVCYFNLPEQSEQTFTKLSNGSTLIHTGDIGYKNTNGDLVYVNRKDWMVKINGQRVETLEIENILSSIDGVSSAVVKAFIDDNFQTYLVAYYVSESTVEQDVVRSILSSRVPEYMIPRYFVKLDSLPKNANGKVDRKSLLPPTADELKSEYVKPTTKLQEEICTAFEEFLNCGKVGIKDNFFVLGGDSIKVISLANKLEAKGVTPKIIIEGATPEKIAQLVSEIENSNDDWQFDDNRTEYPLTVAESAMYIEQKLDPQSVQYNINITVNISGASATAVEKALKKVMGLHEAFKSFYTEKDKKPARVLTDNIPDINIIEVDDPTQINDDNKPFDLSKIPVRVNLYVLPNKEIILKLAMHHIMIDGEGMNLMLNELSLELFGKEISKSKYDLSYSCEHSGENAEKDLEYFKTVFADGVPTNEMPVKKSRPKVHPVSDTMLHYDIDKDVYENLTNCTKMYGATMFEILFSVVAMCLAKYCVSEDVVLGIPKNTRNGKTSQTVGMFVNTLPVRVKPKRTKTFLQYVKEVSQSLRNASLHSDCSFSSLVNEFCLERDSSRHPIFDVGINMLKTSFNYQENGIEINATAEHQKMNRDFNLFFEDNGDQKLKLCIQFSSLLFDKTVIENFVDQIFSTISRISQNKNILIREGLELPDRQKSILANFNSAQDNNFGIQLLHKRFEEQVEKTPDKIAIIACDREYTYRQLNDDANKVANSLIDRGFATGNSAVVMLKRTSEFFPAILGVLKAGGSYIPTDPSYPAQRIKSVLEDSDSKFVITNEQTDEFEHSVTISELLNCQNTATPNVDVKPENLAYMIYTSGSTGKPKGVMIQHKSICNFLRLHKNNVFPYMVANKVNTFLTVTTVAFDMSMKELYSPLLNGKTLVFADEEATLDPRLLVDLFRKTNADGFNATPSRLEQYLIIDGFDEVIGQLKLIGCGGEKYPDTLLSKLKSLTQATIINSYGPTEITVASNAGELESNISVGKPQLNVYEYVVDKFGDELPVGVIGELYIGGMGVAKGYKNLDSMTNEKFIFYDNRRVYKSGDYAKWTPDGKIEILGRTDNQVKLRGLRIELGEIERVISEYPDMQEVIVAIKSINDTEHIVAYFTANKKIDLEKLNTYAQGILTHYMVPTAYMQLDEIPHTLNGKKDMKNLPIPQLLEEKEESTPHRMTKLEEKLAEIVKAITGVTITNINKNLLQYGITSLSAISLVTSIEEHFGCVLPVKEVMQGISIFDIENAIVDNLLTNGTKSKPQDEIDIIENRNYYPLTSSQLGVYYDIIKHPDDIMYNMPVCYVFNDVDIDLLKTSIQKSIEAHPYLNTQIANIDGQLVQMQSTDIECDIPVIDKLEADMISYKKNFVQPFDVHTDVLYRFEIIKTEKHIYLLSDISHIVFDGMSRGILINTIKTAYEQGTVEKEKFSYYSYSLQEEKYRNSEEYKKSEEYYSAFFSEYDSATEIPTDKTSNPETGKLSCVNALIEKDKVNNFCKQNTVTPSTLFLSAVFYTASRFAGSKNVYISTISSGRNEAKIRKTIGMFVKTLPLHMNFEKISDVSDLLAKSNMAMFDAIDNERYPFIQIANKYGFTTDIMYECQLGMGSDKKSKMGNSSFETQYLELVVPKFKVTVAIEDRDTDISISIRYNDAVYTSSYMKTFAECIKVCTEKIMQDLHYDVKHISLLTEEEEKLINSFAVTQEVETPILLLHKLFENNADLYADKTALIASDRTLTYKQLDEKANIIANCLIEKGVAPEDKVTLLLPRTSNYIIATLGVLKSGCAFIPCDPQYPPDRINHIVTDSDASFIITTKDLIDFYPKDKALLIDDLMLGTNTNRPNIEISPESLVYLIYTSGSTGKPKGVMLRHCGICNYLYPHEKNTLFSTVKKLSDVYLSITTVSFDMSMKEIFGSLCNGKTLVFASQDQMNDPRALSELMDTTNTDTINATPSRLLQYIEYKPFKKALANCKLILSGGEMYPLKLRDSIKEISDAIILNTYGPTEITVSSNVADLTNAEYIHIGKPLPNYIEYIVDEDGNKLPHNVIGELYIGGIGVAKGYCNLPEMTAERFVDYNGVRIYKSGDYSKWDKYGNVITLGRKDNQVKLRGLRIELGEIEGLIESQPFIKKAIVIIRKINGSDNLCAYFTAEKQIDISEFKETLSKSLTHYMVPTAYLQLDKIPITPNGKTDIKNLPDPIAVSTGEYIPPANETEKYFCELFGKVLGLEKVGATDNFFEIGGTSLLVTSVVIDATEKGFEITYGDIFQKNTPRLLAGMFEKDAQETKVNIVDFDDYDYTKINTMLSDNTLKALDNGEIRSIGNILLTGATGFMGVHILAHFLQNESGKAYCLLRKGKYKTAQKRLQNVLFYYFGKELLDEFTKRVEVFDGDVTSYDSFKIFEDLKIDTVFNCAANVKHFSSGTDIEDVNVGGVKNCIRLCSINNARLIHFSTTSVCGASIDNVPPLESSVLSERTLYFGQRLDTKYTNSKLLSEREVLQAIADGSIDAKVIRVGTLAARESDGEFQINFLTNNFMGRLRSYMLLGCFPLSLFNSPVCLGPIDTSASAFFELAKTPSKCCLFNAVNNHVIPLSDIIIEMNKVGIKVDFVNDEVFFERLSEAKKDPQKAAILSSMLAYENMAHGKKLVHIPVKSDFTTQVLVKRGFFWNNSSKKYIKAFINMLLEFGFFDSDYLNR